MPGVGLESGSFRPGGRPFGVDSRLLGPSKGRRFGNESNQIQYIGVQYTLLCVVTTFYNGKYYMERSPRQVRHD
jgi:hypothetical protein